MALGCLLRSIPRSLEVCSKRYLTSSQLLKSSTVITCTQFQHSSIQSTAQNSVGIQFASPVFQNCNQQSINLQNVKYFSLSPKRQSDALGDHTKLWTAERILATSMLGILPGAFIFPSQVMDCILAMALVMHNHWGIEAVVVDYVRPIIFGPVIPKISYGLVYVLSITTLVGLFYLIFNDCGFVNAIQLIWKL